MSGDLWLRWRWTYACGATVALALFALVAHGGLWELLGVQHMHPYFADLAAILAAGQAHVAGFNVYEINPFDPFGRPHVYGPLWLLTGQIGWVAADAWWLGLLLVSVFLVVALGLLEPRSFRAAFVVTMVLLSPPVLLGIERANNDLIIFLLFVIGAAAAARQGRAGGYAGAALIVISAGLKFYPLAALPSLFARNGRLRSIAMTVGGGGAIFAVFWWLQRDAIAQALSISPRPSTVFAFGVPLFPIVWEQLVEHRTWLLFGFFVGGVSSISLLWSHRAALWTSLPAVGGRSICAVAGGASWIFCFLATINFPYRVVLLLLVLPWWLALGETSPPARDAALGRRLCALFLATLWLAAPKYWFAELSLGLSVLAAGSANCLMIIVGVEQMIWLVLTVAIGVGLTGWAWRRWRMGPA